MKSALIFVTLISFVLANDLFLGEWKEDQSKRQNLNDFLWARGMLGFIVLTHRYLLRYKICCISYFKNIYDLTKKFSWFSGINWLKRTTATGSSNWWLTMNIAKNDNTYTVDGKSMYNLICLFTIKKLIYYFFCEIDQ